MKVRSVCSFMRFTNGGNLNVLFAISLVGVTDLGKCNRRFFFLEYSEESYCIFMSSYWGLREVLCLVFTWGNGNTKNWSYASELFVDPFTCLEILDDHRGKLVSSVKKTLCLKHESYSAPYSSGQRLQLLWGLSRSYFKITNGQPLPHITLTNSYFTSLLLSKTTACSGFLTAETLFSFKEQQWKHLPSRS